MYQHLRTESDTYHEAIWKLAFGTVVAAAAVASFLFTNKADGVINFGPRGLVALIGGLVFAIGATGSALIHMYAVYYEVTRHIGNEYRNAWLRAETRSELEKKLTARYERALSAYRMDFIHSLRWTFPAGAVAVAGLIAAAWAIAGLKA
jgi:hypothetical protein